MMKYPVYVILSFIILCKTNTYSQTLFYQDIFNGGVTCGSYSSGLGSGVGSIEIYIEPGCSIKKAFLIIQRYHKPLPCDIIFNGTLINLNYNSEITSFQILNFPNNDNSGVHIVDVTSKVSSSQLNYSIEIPAACLQGPEVLFNSVYLMVLYENNTLSKTNVNLILNSQDLEDNISKNYFITNINSINSNLPVGFAIHTDRLNSLSLNDGSAVYFNAFMLGEVGGADLGSSSGVKGSYFYQNQQFIGLNDDTSNTTMSNSDGIANVSSLIPNNSTNYNFNLKWQDEFAQKRYNIYSSFNLTYSTSCDTFTTLVKDKIQVCKEDSIQMQVTSAPLSNHTYEWEPQVGLSCYNCAQPYFTDTVSRWYTVRIWNNDSCSKVLPVRVEVLEKPLNPIVTVSPTKCSDSSGVANVQVVESSYAYSINNGVAQTGNLFNNLPAGVHNVTAIDTNGCIASTTINITETYPNAVFTATPQQGDVPLDVSFYNTSTGANNFIWHIEQDTLLSTNATHIFNKEGYFDAMLVAYDTFPWCSDTASVKIFAEYPFTIFAPTLQDDKKGNYQIYTSGVKSLSYQIYNVLGQIIYTKELDASQGYQDLWSAYTVAKGTYVFKIVAIGENGEEKVVSGKVVVI